MLAALTVQIWNLLTGELLNTVSMPSPITSVICNNATTQIALGCENGVIYFSDLSSCDTAPVKTSVLPHSLQAHGYVL